MTVDIITYVSVHGARYAILLPFDPTSSYRHLQYHEQHLKPKSLRLSFKNKHDASYTYITVPLMLEILPPSCPHKPFHVEKFTDIDIISCILPDKASVQTCRLHIQRHLLYHAVSQTL